MPLTILDPNTALIVIDLQKGIVNGNFIHPIWEVIDRTRALNRCFPCEAPPSRAGQCGGTEQPSDIAVTKRIIREEAHEYSIRNVFARLGETGSTQEIISLLERRSSTS